MCKMKHFDDQRAVDKKGPESGGAPEGKKKVMVADDDKHRL